MRGRGERGHQTSDLPASSMAVDGVHLSTGSPSSVLDVTGPGGVLGAILGLGLPTILGVMSPGGAEGAILSF